MSIKFAAVATLAALAFAPAIAAAQGIEDSVTVSVPAADLDLANPVDRARLDRRIAVAARRACDTGTRGISANRLERACIASLTARSAR